MSTVVEATVPAEQFALYETLQQYPNAEFDILRLVTDGTDRALPFVWATGADLLGLPDALESDPSTEAVDIVADLEDEYLFRMEWIGHIRMIAHLLVEEDASIMDATGRNGSWRFRMLYPERDSVSRTDEFCEDYGIDIEFRRIYQLSDSHRQGQFGLSESQYETLSKAYRDGFYQVPRSVTLEELADQLGVSHQALSERMRRGHGTLIENALRLEPESTPAPR